MLLCSFPAVHRTMKELKVSLASIDCRAESRVYKFRESTEHEHSSILSIDKSLHSYCLIATS